MRLVRGMKTVGAGRRFAAAICVATALGAAMVSPAGAAELATDDVQIAVVGGQVAPSNPGAVHLVNDSLPMACTASLISPRWVLTAWHCVDESGIAAPTGIVSNSTVAGRGTFTAVRRIHQAPGGDTALLELASDAPGPLLRYAGYTMPLGETATVYGWGATGTSGVTSSMLKYADMKALQYAPNSFYPNGSDVVMQGIDGVPYFGDSGGPLVHRGVVVGTVSGGDHNGNDVNALEYFALTAPNASWIAQMTGVQPVLADAN